MDVFILLQIYSFPSDSGISVDTPGVVMSVQWGSMFQASIE